MNQKTKGILWGIAIIAVGILWGLNKSNILDFTIFFDGWWTLFIIIPSIVGLFKSRDKTASAIFLAIGIFLLINANVNLKPIRVLIWPAIVVLIGIYIIVKNIKNSKSEPPQFKEAIVNPNYQEYSATFAEQKYVFDQQFLGGKFSAAFGSINIDLSRAYIQPGTLIDARANFGGVEITVPQNIRVVIKSHGFFGGTSDKSNKNLPFDAPTLYVDSSCLFGGVNIKTL